MDDLTRQRLNREGRRIGESSDALACQFGIESLGPRYFDRQGKPMGMGDWAASFEDFEGRRIATAYTRKPGHPRTRISTVWLGLNHNHFGGPPLIFETMVFGGPLDGEMDRYATEDQALAGHHRMVAQVLALPLWRVLVWHLTSWVHETRYPYPDLRGLLYRSLQRDDNIEPLWLVERNT